MNRIKRIVPILLMSIVFWGCREKSDNNHEKTLTVITGNVSNMEVYPNTKEFTLDILDFRGKKTSFRDSIKSDGTFKFEFDLYKTQDINLNPLVGKIIAHPGDSINLKIDFSDIGNIHFSGDSKKSNTDLYKYLNSYYCVFEFSNRETVKMSFSAYKSFCDSVKLVADNKQHEFIVEFNPTTELINWTKDYINIGYQKSLLNFPYYVAYVSKVKYPELDIPHDYYSFLEHTEKEFSDSIINTSVYGLINMYTPYFRLKTIVDTTLKGDNYASAILSEIVDKHKESIFKQLLIGNAFYQKLNQNNLDFFKNYSSVFDNALHDAAIKRQLTNYSEELERQLKNPQINSNATLAKLNDTPVKSLIDTLLLQNKGKVIYIDYWATWCAPCKAEMPNSKKLRQKFVGEDIEFVYLCLDSNEKQWKLTLSQMQLDGKHYLCDSEQSSAIRKGFGIRAIPYYMLVNKNGHIVDSGGYLRPMKPVTIDKIKKLLHEE